MTYAEFHDTMAIDTNVFMHLLYDRENTDQHINELLSSLRRTGIALLVDDGGRIAEEYRHQIGQRIRRAYDQGNELQLLRYWMDPQMRVQVPVNHSSDLMKEIKKVIVEPKEAVDRVFVHVALSKGTWLVSNDRLNIVCGPPKERRLRSRRHRILRDTKKFVQMAG